MKIYPTLFCMLLLSNFDVKAGDCSQQFNDQLNILSQENEIIRYSLKELFPDPLVDYISFQEPNAQFAILPPIRQLNENTYPEQKLLQSIIDAKSKLAPHSKYPLNQYVILNKIAPDYELYYSLPSQGKSIVDIQYQASRNNNQDPLNCFGTDYLDSMNVVVDCARPEVLGNPLENIMIVYTNIQANEYVEYPNPNNGNYESVTKRIVYAQQNENRNIIIRGTPYDAIKQEENSIIEILEITNNQIQTIMIIDEDQLKQISDISKFQLVDFKSDGLNNLAILNKNGSILEIIFNINLQILALKNQINTKDTNLISFNYRFNNGAYVAVSKTTLYSSHYKYKFKLALENPQVYFCQEFILVLDGKEIYQFSYYQEFLYKRTLNEQGYMISSQVRNEFIIFSKQKIDKFTLHQESQIQYQSKVQLGKKSIKLKQNNPGTAECVLEIFYQTIQFGSTDIIAVEDPQEFLREGILTSGKSTFYQNINYNPLFKGSELIYSNTDNDELSLKFDYYYQKHLPDINKTKNRILYSAVILMDGLYRVSIEEDDFVMLQYTCQDYDEGDMYCVNDVTEIVGYQLTDYNAVSTGQSNGIFTHYRINEDGLSLTQTQYYGEVTWKEFGKLTAGRYEQITTTTDYLVALNKQQNVLTIFNLNDISLYFYIDEQAMKNLGIDNFRPTTLNLKTYSNYILVSSNDMIYFLKIDAINLFYIGAQFQLDLNNVVERKLVILKSYLVVCDRKQNKSVLLSIYKLDTNFFSSIYFEKQVQYFQYNYDEEWQVGTDFNNNAIYLVGKQGFQPTLTVYSIPSISQSVPAFSFQITENGHLATSQSQLFVFSQYEAQQYYINTKPQAMIQVKRPLSKYSIKTSIIVKVSNPQKNFSYDQKLTLVNINSQIVMDPSKANPNMLRQNRNELACFDQKEWITGQIISTTISCMDCTKGGITLTEQITKQDQLTDMKIEASYAVLDLNNSQFVALQQRGFTIYDKIDYTKTFTTNFDPLSACYQITTPNETLILVGCTTSQGINQIVSYKCSQNSCQLDRYLVIENQARVGIIVVNNYLFVASAQDVAIYYLVDGIEKLDKAKKVTTTQAYVQQMQVQNSGQDSYYIYLLSQYNTLTVYIHTLTNGESKNPQKVEIDLVSFIESQELYFTKNSKINGIWPLDGNNKFLFTITDAAQYAFSFTYKCENNKCTLSQTNLEFILSPYGNWELNSIPIVSVTKKYVALNYQNYFLRNRIVVYQIDKPVQDALVAISIVGGIQDDPFNSENLQVLIYEKNGKDYITATLSVFKQFQLYQIHGPIDICFQNIEDNEKIFITAKNDFDLEQKLVDIRINSYSKTTDHLWIWIILALVVLGSVGGLSYYLYQKKKRNNQTQNAQLIA